VTPEQRMTVEAMALAWSHWQDSPKFPFADDHCINGARVVTRALLKMGIQSRPVSVSFMLFNRPAWFLYQEGVPMHEWPNEAWSIGCGPGVGKGVGGKWDGHLCVEGVADPTLPREQPLAQCEWMETPPRHGGPRDRDSHPAGHGGKGT